jgi:hypothetical protein
MRGRVRVRVRMIGDNLNFLGLKTLIIQDYIDLI